MNITDQHDPRDRGHELSAAANRREPREILLRTDRGESRIVVGRDLPSFREACGERRIVVVADSLAARFHEARLQGYDAVTISSSEADKSLETVTQLYGAFHDRRLERGACIVAFGGGIVTDIAGYAAATYLRGLGFVSAPTTLLAQVDASVGGKNGVNFNGHKNLIGATRQAEVCLCDTAFLATLPRREFSCGFAEVIKHAAIASIELFQTLEQNAAQLFDARSEALADVIYRSIQIKAAIVEADEFEHGDRAKLNFGHTVGHGIEAVHHLPHGEAIAIGMIAEARLSEARGSLSAPELMRLERLFEAFGLPVALKIDADAVMAAIASDKKRASDSVTMTVLNGLGASRLERVTMSEIWELVSGMNA